MLGIHKSLPKPLEFWAANYQAAVDPETLTSRQQADERAVVDSFNQSQAGGGLGTLGDLGLRVFGFGRLDRRGDGAA